MYIEPNTNIRILKGVPLDTSYDHTIYFSSASAQTNYFLSLVKYNLTNYSYQRVRRGYMRVGIQAENLYDCNYIMYQNTAFGNKWFYAFIRSVEYVNNECSEIQFEIDVMQTWFFNYEPDWCFIERQHTDDDIIGNHIEPEPVDLGEYVMNNYEAITDMTSMCVVIAIVDVTGSTAEQTAVDGNLYDGIYGGATLWAYNSTDVQGINAKLEEYLQKPDAVVSMYMCPLKLIGSIPSTHKLAYGASAIKTTVQKGAVGDRNTIDGYTPKNNKLYTYPYTFYHVDNANGASLALRYEFFQYRAPILEISGTITNPVKAILRPCNYKGSGVHSELGGDTSLNTESISLEGYPMCSWNTDAYLAWSAQNSIPIGLGLISSLGSGLIGGAMTGNPSAVLASGAVSVIGQTANVLSQGYKASIGADISKGSLNNGGGNVANKKQQFYGGQCSITHQQARIIDDFFNMYGYAVKQCAPMNRNVRPHWNYVKTIGCTITGSIPCDDMRKICSIYDNGITFWMNGNEVGNYSLNNKLVAEGGH